eukprot:TRINITY_DN1458_c0_g2_i1.p2 TRINITY_DN1458_c0_g2~~TRINITY_DN1458_c0_g2_i1.p2  ORF type:complete len:103 (+),score=7.36 TRINITY_DN1458_c0_g2_i1:415-723(+)
MKTETEIHSMVIGTWKERKRKIEGSMFVSRADALCWFEPCGFGASGGLESEERSHGMDTNMRAIFQEMAKGFPTNFKAKQKKKDREIAVKEYHDKRRVGGGL